MPQRNSVCPRQLHFSVPLLQRCWSQVHSPPLLNADPAHPCCLIIMALAASLPPHCLPKLQQSQQALARAAQLARTVHASGGTFFFEAHPASTAWSDPELQHTLQACGCVLARVPFCGHGLDLHGAWLIASNEPQTSTLGHTCQHPLGTHRVQLLKRKHEPNSAALPSQPLPNRARTRQAPCLHRRARTPSPAATASLALRGARQRRQTAYLRRSRHAQHRRPLLSGRQD